ncbi:jg16737 [Pararge aegeria aegeria]|uniref:Jg16737 protein n=1 Tax=Pararge aegeria aegeria TaxID=348720 RepID=A0A8S4S4Y4_9NEOP|nr:jg16737 [Pararge aegeria aegeria]
MKISHLALCNMGYQNFHAGDIADIIQFISVVNVGIEPGNHRSSTPRGVKEDGHWCFKCPSTYKPPRKWNQDRKYN